MKLPRWPRSVLRRRSSEIADLLTWRIEPATPGYTWVLRPLMIGANAVVVVASLPTGSGIPGPFDTQLRTHLPDGEGEPIDFPGDSCTVRGETSYLPRPAFGRQPVTITMTDASVVRSSWNSVRLPLTEMTVVQVRPVGLSRRRAVRSRWVLLANHDEATLEFRGTWLQLAWLAKLGHWSEPC